MKEFKCKKCGYEWIPRTENPMECPSCKNRRWQIKKTIYYKPVQEFPIIFQGEHYRFLIDDELKFYFCRNNKQYLYCSKSDIEANKKALKELERLKKN